MECKLEYLETSHRSFCLTHQCDEIKCVQRRHDRYKKALEKIIKMPLGFSEVNGGTREMKNVARFALDESTDKRVAE